MTETPDILTLKAADAGYGKKQVLFGIDLVARTGKITAIIGPNGAGKSTVLKVVHGLQPLWSGSAEFDGSSLGATRPAQRVRRGIAWSRPPRQVARMAVVPVEKGGGNAGMGGFWHGTAMA